MKDKAINDAMNSIKNRISHVYNQGYEDGKGSVQIDDSTAYEAGLNDAWELVRKVHDIGYNSVRQEIFGQKYGMTVDIVNHFSIYEAAAKIKEYEEKQKKDYWEGCRYWDKESKRGCKSPCIEKIEYEGKAFAEFLVSQINDLPLVTPQPKMGRWIEHFDEIGKWYECDQCHSDWGGPVNYCPNCGCAMKGEEE